MTRLALLAALLLSTSAGASEPELSFDELGSADQEDLPDTLMFLRDGSSGTRRFDAFRELSRRSHELNTPEARANQRLARAVLIFGWAGALGEDELVGRLVDRAAQTWPDVEPHRLARDILGPERANPVIDAISYRPGDGEVFNPPKIPGMGVLAFYRPVSGMEWAILSSGPNSATISVVVPQVVSVGEDGVALLSEGSYAWVYLPAGEHTLAAAWGTADARRWLVQRDVREGGLTWVKVSQVGWSRTGEAEFDVAEGEDSLFHEPEEPAKVHRSSRGWLPAGAMWMSSEWRAPLDSIGSTPAQPGKDGG